MAAKNRVHHWPDGEHYVCGMPALSSNSNELHSRRADFAERWRRGEFHGEYTLCERCWWPTSITIPLTRLVEVLINERDTQR